MKRKTKAIPVRILADIIDVHKNTLNSWLCHYSLTKYFFTIYTNKGCENMFVINKDSVNALRKYLSVKKRKYLAYFDARIDLINKYC
ncbi:hypothetical protein IKP85_05590 [bacterium]|nr:hypothetical protein [bacterium]